MTVTIDRTTGRTINLTYHRHLYLLIQFTRTWALPSGKFNDPSALAVERPESLLAYTYQARTSDRWAAGTILYTGPNNTESIFGTVVTSDHTYYRSTLIPGMVSSHASAFKWDVVMQDKSGLSIERFKKSRTRNTSSSWANINMLGFDAIQESHSEEAVPGETATVWTVYVPVLDYLEVAYGNDTRDKNGRLTIRNETYPVVLSANVPEKFVALPPANAREIQPSEVEKAVMAASGKPFDAPKAPACLTNTLNRMDDNCRKARQRFNPNN
jgi:hypothetical protein